MNDEYGVESGNEFTIKVHVDMVETHPRTGRMVAQVILPFGPIEVTDWNEAIIAVDCADLRLAALGAEQCD